MPRIFVRHQGVVALCALRSRIVSLLSAGLASLAATASAAAPASAQDNQHFPGASDFVDHINNPFFPLVPGTTFVYAGTKDGLVLAIKPVLTPGTVGTVVKSDDVWEQVASAK